MGEELVLQALIYLHAIDLGVDAPGGHASTSVRIRLRVLGIGRGHGYGAESMVSKLGVYDEDPAGWTVRHFQKMVRDFATRSGADRARSFGAKLVAAGHLTTADVLDALR